MLAGYTQLSAIAAPSTSRINTPSAWSKPQRDAVHRKGRTPIRGQLCAPIDTGSGRSFSAFMRGAIRTTGLLLDCQPHGLRKAAGRRRLLVAELMALLGHKTLRAAKRYS